MIGFNYDHAERITSVNYTLGNNTITLATNTYDELGRLKSKSHHGSNANILTYDYNIRGWTKKIESPKFTQKLYYTDGNSTPCYNGNISSMTWKADAEAIRGYKFTYDHLNRMTNAGYGEGDDLSANSERFSEIITGYDRNGNILGLKRNGKGSSSAYDAIDNLTLTYDGNQLKNVTDAATDPLYNGVFNFVDESKGSGTEYIYDSNGNMQQDYNKKISKIQYNLLNLPAALQFTNGNRKDYTYSADGKKLKVVHKTAIANISVPMGQIKELAANQVSQTHTVDYCGNVIYENRSLSKVLTEEGYVTLSGTTPTFYYYLKDHQGNNRMVVRLNGASWNTEQVNHYYPFGGVFEVNTETSGKQSYKYNGKELDRMHGLDWYDYGARMMDAALGRWHVMDPMAEKYYEWSPYAYCANNPLKHVDPDGRSWYSYNQDGKTIYEWNINIRSQEDLDKIRENAIYIGNTHSDGDTYYSLFGNKYSIDSKEGKTMQKIDEALINYSQASPQYDYYGNLISGGENVTDFNIGEYPQNSSLNLSEDTYFTFQAEGGLVTYFKVSKGVDNKAKFGGFGYVTKGQVRGQGNRGIGNLKDGIPIYFERQNTPGNIVQRSAQIIFPTQKAADSFYQKYSLILKRK